MPQSPAPHNRESLDRLIHLCYQAAIDPDLWNTFLELLLREFNGKHAGLMIHGSGNEPAVFREVGIEGTGEEYNRYYHSVDVVWPRAAHRVNLGEVLTLEQIVSSKVFLASEYYNDFWKPRGCRQMIGTGIPPNGPPGPSASLTIWSGSEAGPYDEPAVAALSHLRGHIGRAVQIMTRLATQQERASAMSDTLDKLAQGILLLDEKAECIYLNTAAEILLRRGDGLSITARRLATLLPQEQANLNRVLNQGSGTINISRASGLPAYNLIVSPVASDAMLVMSRRALTLVLVVARGTGAGPSPDILRELFRLTPAEIKLAALLNSGLTIKEAALRLNIALNTAQTHLKRIHSKTHTTRQAELLQLLALLPREPGGEAHSDSQ